MGTSLSVSVAIPTLARGRVLTDTVRMLLNCAPTASEILVIDQTQRHDDSTRQALDVWHQAGRIRWIRLSAPSIPGAMNVALREANHRIVLFLDDDITPDSNLIAAHSVAYGESDEAWAVAGQVLQPGEEAQKGPLPNETEGLLAGLGFSFRSTQRAWVQSVMAGNLSVRRDRALQVGGFDENFVGAAYRFETEFCRRIWKHGGKVLFEPKASLRHLRAGSGGTRTAGDHLRSHRPDHSIGDYYFAFLHGSDREVLGYVSRRLVRSVTTRYHLRHPWWIAPKLIGEIRGLFGAIRLVRQGQRLLSPSEIEAAL
jgi:GT2 family glycosyltransferase